MLLAIARDSDSLVVAVASNTTIQALDDLQTTLLDHHFVEVQDSALWADIRVRLRTKYGYYRFIETPPGSIAERLLIERRWAVVDTRTDVIIGTMEVLNGRSPELRPWQRAFEIDQATFEMLGSGLLLPDSSSPRWVVDASDNITEVTDSRLQLEITTNPADGVILDGQPITITLTLKDSSGNPVSFSGTREVVVINPDGLQRLTRVTLSNGVATANPNLSLGTWGVESADPDLYRVTGNKIVKVVDSW